MTDRIDITTNALELKNFLNRAKRDQLPFATSKAINALASDVRKLEQTKLDEYFELRTRWLKKRGAMPLKMSDKRQWPDIHAILSVKDEIAAMSITGGLRQGDMAVPLSEEVAGIRTSTRKQLNPSKGTLGPPRFPGRIVKKRPPRKPLKGRTRKAQPFILRGSKAEDGVYIRTGNGRRIKALYLFQNRVRVPQTWPLPDNVDRFIGKYYEQQFRLEFDKAFRSRKR